MYFPFGPATVRLPISKVLSLSNVLSMVGDGSVPGGHDDCQVRFRACGAERRSGSARGN